MFLRIPGFSRKFLLAVIMANAGLATFAMPAAHAGSITVYTALEEDEIKDYLEVAKKDLPDIDIKVLRLSTGDISARLVAEAAHPRNDVVWGVAATNVMDSRITQLLEPYRAKGEDRLAKNYKAADGKWFAVTGFMGAFCVNTEVLKAKNLPMPQSWSDLAKPVYKGEVVMPNPVSSGTGYLQIAGILQKNGDAQGWKLLKAMDGNIAQYTKSGSAPCKMARTGEYAIGASLAFAAMQAVDAGFPVKMVIPRDAAGYELEASGLMAASDNKADAKRFLDWTLSSHAAAVYTKYKDIITLTGVQPSGAAKAAGLPADLTKVLYPMDFAKSSRERQSILDTWQKTIGR